jgi:hypothetical protein
MTKEDDATGCGICCGGWLFLLLLGCLIVGSVFMITGSVDGCDHMLATVTNVARNPSALATGNSVVHFEYNATRYSVPIVAECSVAIHNTWLDIHTEDHYPIGSTHNIYDCKPSKPREEDCQTAESMGFNFTLGLSFLLVAAVVICMCCVAPCVQHCVQDCEKQANNQANNQAQYAKIQARLANIQARSDTIEPPADAEKQEENAYVVASVDLV